MLGWTPRVPVLISKQFVQVSDFWAVWSCVYLLRVFFRKILEVLFVTKTVESATTHSLSELMGWKSRWCCLQMRGAALFCWAASPGAAGVDWSCRSCWGALLIPLAWSSLGRGMPWVHKCGAPCPSVSAQTRAQALPERLWGALHTPAICD